MNDDLTRLGLIDDDEITLDEASLDLARLDHPDIDLAPSLELLETIAARLDVAPGIEISQGRAAALSRVLGEELGFAGDTDNYDDPANADMIQVIKRRRGLPVSLSILYVGAARRAGWMANILDVPGHVLVLIGGDASPVIIDPFRSGIAVDHTQLSAMLMAVDGGADLPVRQVSAMTNRAVLVRLLLNQATRAERAGQQQRARELYTRMTVMAPDFGQIWWERARLELVDHDVVAARNSLAALLEITREPDIRRRVIETFEALSAS